MNTEPATGRPRLPADEMHAERVVLYLSPSEKAAMTASAKASGMKPATWGRLALLAAIRGPV